MTADLMCWIVAGTELLDLLCIVASELMSGLSSPNGWAVVASVSISAIGPVSMTGSKWWPRKRWAKGALTRQ